MDDLWLLVLGAFAIGAWWWSISARDRVDLISREVCGDLRLQRLDEAVTLRRTRFIRGPGGPAIERVFGFEFSVNGADRHLGEVCLQGLRACWVRLDHPDGDIHIDLGTHPPEDDGD